MPKRKPKEPFTLTKVIDPHSNMPEDIKESFFEGIRGQHGDYGPNNESYVWWTVGDYLEVLDEDDDDYEEENAFWEADLKKVDEWMLENGLTKGERVIVLYWW